MRPVHGRCSRPPLLRASADDGPAGNIDKNWAAWGPKDREKDNFAWKQTTKKSRFDLKAVVRYSFKFIEVTANGVSLKLERH